MTYTVKEIFLSIQGEGYHTGRRAVFVRFAGCNLWSGREEDRATAQCKFCDTDFIGGERLTAQQIAHRAAQFWGDSGERFVVLTGGEPTLQVDGELICEFEAQDFEIAIETNGTHPVPEGVHWICVSPKHGTKIVQTSGDELKVVLPQPFLMMELSRWDFDNYFVQPMDGREGALKECLDVIHWDPVWKLSLQSHKMLGLR